MTRSLPWRALLHFTVAALATVLFVLLAGYVLSGTADATDRAMALAIHRHASTALDYVMIALTLIGGWQIRVMAVLLTMGWLLRNQHRHIALVLGVNTIVAQLLDTLFKHLVARPRPTIWSDIALPDSFSFPSGHSLTSMVVYGGIAAVFVILRPWRRPLVIAAASLVIFGVGFSRVYLGVHWPSDVLAGFAAGVPLVVATVHLLHTRGGPKTGRQGDEMNVYSPA